MKNISSHVDEYMQGYPFLSKFLRQGVVNYKALARSIEPDISTLIGEKVSIGAIAVSLQRIHHRDKDKLYNLIGRLKGVKVISNVSSYTVREPAAAYRVIAALHAEGSLDKPFVAIVAADTETLVVAERFAAAAFKEPDFHKGDVKLTGLVITREVVEDAHVESGGLSYPLGVLAEHGILVRAVTATFTEEVILVDEALADRAASILRHAMWR